jgi:RIO kinase 1
VGKNKEAEQLGALGELIEALVIDEVIGVIKSGKEATVYCCRGFQGEPPRVAAKVYRDRDVRRFSNDYAYVEGRTRGMARQDIAAIAAKSRAGREIAFGQWVVEEWKTLRLLYDAGCDVPEPLYRDGRVILMEYIGDDDDAAPMLAHADLDRDEAGDVFERLMRNIELMLACDRVHGDLSPFNVLYREGELRIIDFPQAIDPRFNGSAMPLLQRDIERICEWAARRGVEADGARIARTLWARFLRSDL